MVSCVIEVINGDVLVLACLLLLCLIVWLLVWLFGVGCSLVVGCLFLCVLLLCDLVFLCVRVVRSSLSLVCLSVAVVVVFVLSL